MIESIEKPQESIRKNRNPHRVIPAQAGIQKRNAAGLYRKKPKPHRPSFPQKLESKNATRQDFIGKNRNPRRVIPAQAGIQKRNAAGLYRKKQKPPPRHSRASGNPKTQRGRTLSEKTETPPTVIPAKAGIQKRNAAGLYQKKQKPHRRHSRKSGNLDPSARNLTG